MWPRVRSSEKHFWSLSVVGSQLPLDWILSLYISITCLTGMANLSALVTTSLGMGIDSLWEGLIWTPPGQHSDAEGAVCKKC